jgi:hypothetical protein
MSGKKWIDAADVKHVYAFCFMYVTSIHPRDYGDRCKFVCFRHVCVNFDYPSGTYLQLLVSSKLQYSALYLSSKFFIVKGELKKYIIFYNPRWNTLCLSDVNVK